MGTYIGKVQIGNDSSNLIALGDTLYGTCASTASATTKSVVISTFDRVINGIQLRVKFTNGNTVTTGGTLTIDGSSPAISFSIAGDFTCSANEVVTFTFEENTSNSANSVWRVTGGAVSQSIKDYISSAMSGTISAIDSMVFKGTLGTTGNITTVPNGNANATPSQAYKTGWTYKIVTAGTYAGITCEVGDLLIAMADSASDQTSINNAHWTVAQGNLDGAVTGPASATNNHIAIFDQTTGKIIKDSGYTIETSVPSGAVFTDTNTSYKYTLSNGTTSAYTASDAMVYTDADNTGTVLVAVENGILKLAKGIKFTTSSNTVTLTESSAAGPTVS